MASTGLGKSWLACALGHKACRENLSVLYHRMPELFADLALARRRRRHARSCRLLGRAELSSSTTGGPSRSTPAARHDLLEIVEERYGRRSTIITTQFPSTAGMT